MDEQYLFETEHVSFSYETSRETTDGFALHCHNYYEVYYFVEGDVEYLVEGQKYTPEPGSMILIAPHVFHGVKINSANPYRRFSLHFDPNLLSLERRSVLCSAFPILAKAPRQQIYYTDGDRRIFSCFHALMAYSSLEPELQHALFPVGVEALLSQIVCMSADRTGSLPTHSQTVFEIIWYLNQNLKTDISLDSLSQRFHISKHHLNKLFRKATGTTVFDYLIHKRVNMAHHLLLNGFSAQEAAADAGFSDYSAFYRAYVRILGHSPSKDKEAGHTQPQLRDLGLRSLHL